MATNHPFSSIQNGSGAYSRGDPLRSPAGVRSSSLGSSPGGTPAAREVTRRGILTSVSASTYTANVLIMEATDAFLQGVPVATHIDGTSAIVGTLCAVHFFDEQNYTDAVVMAVYPNGSQGVPTP